MFDFLNTDEIVPFMEVDKAYPLCRAAHDADIFHRDAECLSCVGHQDNAILIGHRNCPDDNAIALACDDRTDADAAAVGLAEVFDPGAFAISIFTNDERLSVTVHHFTRDNAILFIVKGRSADTSGDSAHRSDLSLIEADGHPISGKEHDLLALLWSSGRRSLHPLHRC